MKAVVFDIDDLLIDPGPRKEAYMSDLLLSDDVDLVKRRYNKGWYSHLDTTLPYARAVVRYFIKQGFEIFFVTGRRESALGTSIKVMNDLGFPVSEENSYFKPTGVSNTPKHKKKAFRDILKRGYTILYFFDDKEDNLDAAEELGIPNRYTNVAEFALEIVESV